MYRRILRRYLTSNFVTSRAHNKSNSQSHSTTKIQSKTKHRDSESSITDRNPPVLSAVAQLFLSKENPKLDITQEQKYTKPSDSHTRNLINDFVDEDDTDTDNEYEENVPKEEDEIHSDDEDILHYAEGELHDYKEDVIAVQNLPLLHHQTVAEEMNEIKSGTPNPKIPMSDVTCQGCGAFYHCKDPSIPGYLPSERFTSLSKRQLKFSLCQRCNLMRNYDICLNVKSTEKEFEEIISTINKEIALIILVVDLTDIRNSLMSQLFKLIHKKGRPIYIVGNKIDSVPMDESGYLKRIRTVLFEECEKAGLNPTGKNIKHICLVSAKTGYGIENLVTHLIVNWRYKGNVYLLGNTNVGKSTLFNALLQSDYCKSRAREIINRATVSVWPGTTISTLKFPIMNPKPWRIAMREKRIKVNKPAIQEEKNLQMAIAREKDNLRSKWKAATLSGYLGVTDFREDDTEITRYEIPSFEMRNDSVVCNVGRDPILNLPTGLEFDDIPSKQAHWLFDTPGVINQEQIINLMSQKELVSLLPTEVVPPRVYLLKPGQTMFITAFGRIDYIEGDHGIFMTVHVTQKSKVHIMNTEEADEFYKENYGTEKLQVPIGDKDRLSSIPCLSGQDFYLSDWIGENTALADIQLSSLGWVSVTKYRNHPVRLQAYTPSGRGLYLREPALLPNIRAFRGKRIGGKQEYRIKPPRLE